MKKIRIFVKKSIIVMGGFDDIHLCRLRKCLKNESGRGILSYNLLNKVMQILKKPFRNVQLLVKLKALNDYNKPLSF